jgi:hypothetical protein
MAISKAKNLPNSFKKSGQFHNYFLPQNVMSSLEIFQKQVLLIMLLGTFFF